MKKLHKCLNWVLLLSILLTNSPIMYAEEISQAIEQSQAEQAYQEAVEEANNQIVSSDNANTEKPASEQTGPSTKKEDGDAIQQPKVTDGANPEEAALKAQYGEPVAVSGQEQLFRVDDTHFVTYIGSDVKTYIDQEGVEVPVDLSLYS